MKVSELNQIIESIVADEVRRTIMEESKGKKEVYHIKCEGIPLATFESEDEAQEELPKYKSKNKGELIIEKGVYESQDDMLDKLDEINDQLEEEDNMKNTQEPMEGNAFSAALIKAKENGEKTFTVDGEEHDVEECWGQMEEEELREEDDCQECGGNYMEEELVGGQKKLDKNHNGKIDRQDFKILKGQKKDVNEGMCEKCGKEICECGSGSGMYESKKKTLRLTEKELTGLIAKMVNESVPGLEAAKKSRTESGKENNSHLSDVDKKMKDYLSIPGNNNNEFPQQNKKGDNVKVNPTSEEDETIADERGRGLENLEYQHEPSSQFKDRLKKAIEGHATMGNSQDYANVVKTDLPKKLEKEVKRKSEDKKEEPRYKKEAQPTKAMNEAQVRKSNILEEEIKKMKNIFSYNKKTQ
jgi:hypothetical protein